MQFLNKNLLFISKISKNLNEMKNKNHSIINKLEIVQIEDLIENNARFIQEYFDFKFKVEKNFN